MTKKGSGGGSDRAGLYMLIVSWPEGEPIQFRKLRDGEQVRHPRKLVDQNGRGGKLVDHTE